MSEAMNEDKDCEVCTTMHAERVSLNPDGSCLCCQSDHKPTCYCGAPGDVTVDPFDAEIHNDYTLCILCDDCSHERAMEI